MFSAVIIARDESRTIKSCIEQIKKVTDDVIIILDDRTTDNTELLAQKAGAKVISHPWKGFSANKNFGASIAVHDWILCLDADEIIDDNLIIQLNQLRPQTDTVYHMNILTYVGKTPIKYGGWHPDWNIRLYNKTIMEWDRAMIHEKLISKNKENLKVRRLNGLVHHYSFADWSHMLDKYDNYAKIRAEFWIKKEKKPLLIKKFLGPNFRFFKTFILKAGFLDGRAGLNLACAERQMKKNEWKYYDQLREKLKL
jgi:glycosyltransferase involved in cell wall biosynthesis